MWKDKGLQLVMLPTKDSIMTIDSLVKSKTGLLHRLKSCSLEAMCSIYEPTHQYLYLISDEKPNDGDMCLDGEYIFGPYEDGDFPVCSRFRSIIACLNPSLNLPQFPSSFLEEYVKRYNSKKSLEVEIDYIKKYIRNGVNKRLYSYKPNLIYDNTIFIRFKEERKYSWSEVEELCGKAFNAGEAYRTGSCDLFKQIHPDKHEWIKKNLK